MNVIANTAHMNRAAARTMVQQDVSVYGFVDRGEGAEVVGLHGLETFDRFDWASSCSGWWPLPQLGFYLTEVDARRSLESGHVV